MIRPEKISKLEALWAVADKAFRSDDDHLLDMADEIPGVLRRRAARRAREEAKEAALPPRDLVSIEWTNAWGSQSSQMVPRDKAAAMLRRRMREAQNGPQDPRTGR
ncbi:hypothetical protein [Microbacterium sp. CFBP 8794]|uniref:hypothetical protein n=1 Tax=Microbacterium sp. CFBP 8794 TaxID=2775269 RepID=UPI00177BE69B|nr:hypothetical protein [Microbacterium sp. CFBP 8794]MBD8477706.1 hypothetical protein [Microbacterium sp. CFBP 8794]